MPYGGTDYARIDNLAGIDEVVSNERSRASLYPVTVGTVTFPVNPLGTCYYQGAGTPISTTPGASSTIDIGQLLTGIIVQAPSAANTSTLDTAANIVKGINQIGSGAVVGDVITCMMFNGSATNTITIAAGSGGGFDSNNAGRVIPIATATSNSSKQVLIRLTNVTSGSEAYVVYL